MIRVVAAAQRYMEGGGGGGGGGYWLDIVAATAQNYRVGKGGLLVCYNSSSCYLL